MSKPSLKEQLLAKLLPPKPEVIFYDDYEAYKFDAWYAQLEANVDELFANAVEVVGVIEPGGHYLFDNPSGPTADTHRALLIGVEPIERGVTKEQVLHAFNAYLNDPAGPDHFRKFAELVGRIEREGLKP